MPPPSIAHDPVSLRADAYDRPPHWRWIRAHRIVEQQTVVDRRRDDLWVQGMAVFLRRYAEAHVDGRAEVIDRLADHNPVLFWAHRLAFNTRDSNARMRDQLEARLLCRDYRAEVTAAKLGLQPAQVQAYEAVFFSVRDRLDNLAWVTSMVLGPAVVNGFNPKGNSDLVLKLAGWLYGDLAVDILAGRSYDGRPPGGMSGINAAVDAAESFEARWRSYLTTRALTVDQFTAPIIFQHAADVRRRDDDQAEVRRDSGAAGGEMTMIKALVDSLAAVRVQVGVPTLTGTVPSGGEFDAVEPRAHELFFGPTGAADPNRRPARFPEVVAHDR